MSFRKVWKQIIYGCRFVDSMGSLLNFKTEKKIFVVQNKVVSYNELKIWKKVQIKAFQKKKNEVSGQK